MVDAVQTDGAMGAMGAEADPAMGGDPAGQAPQGDMFAEFMKQFAPGAQGAQAGQEPGAEPGVGETAGTEDTGVDTGIDDSSVGAEAFDPAAIAQLIAADPAKGAETLQTIMAKYKESVIAEAQAAADTHMSHKEAVAQYFKDNADMEPHKDLFAILAKEENKGGKHKDMKSLVAAAGASARKMLGKPAAKAPALPGAGPAGSTPVKTGDSQSDLAADYEKRLSGR